MAGDPSNGVDTRPVAVGYLRAEQPDEALITGWREEIASFCAGRGYRLATVYCDRGYDGSEMARPGFAGLLDALAVPACTAAVVLAVDHLSLDDIVQDTLQRHIRRTGADLLIVRTSYDGADMTRSGTDRTPADDHGAEDAS